MPREDTESPAISGTRDAPASASTSPTEGQRDFDRQLRVLLSVSTFLATTSLCTSLPFLGAASLFQTPFVSISTLSYNIATLRKHRRFLNESLSSNDLEGTEATGLLPPHGRGSAWQSVANYEEMNRVQDLGVHWLLTAILVILISGVLTYASSRSNMERLGDAAVSKWLLVMWAEAACDVVQACTLGLLHAAMSKEYGRLSAEWHASHDPEVPCTLGNDTPMEVDLSQEESEQFDSLTRALQS